MEQYPFLNDLLSIFKFEMTLQDQQISERLSTLGNTLDGFISFFQDNKNYDQLVSTYWTAKDVLGHVTFWHESFARNLQDVAEGRKANPLKGKLSEVNKISVDSTRIVPIDVLCQRLIDAQETITRHIFNTSVNEIPYKKGSRNYSRLEHLQVVNAHIAKHFRDIIKKLNQSHVKTNKQK